MRIAIVHDWLETIGGSELVLEQLLNVFPDADLFSLVDFLPEDKRGVLRGRRPVTSMIQTLPFARQRFRLYLPLFPLAIEQLPVQDYDVVLSSSHAIAKGVLTGPEQVHICYCHSPIRYAWDLQDTYLQERGISRGPGAWIARYILHRLRNWDRISSIGVDRFIANSNFVRRRIWRCYRREADVIYPPVDTETFVPRGEKEDFYLTVSRLVPYKRVSLIVEAFRKMPQRRLVVVGDGPQRRAIQAAIGDASNIELLGSQPRAAVVDHMQRARAFVFAAAEDFGIVVPEASACATPVIAFAGGAARETVRDLSLPSPTGVLFDRQHPDDIVAAVERFEREGHAIRPENCRAWALQFSTQRFNDAIRMFVDEAYRAKQADRTASACGLTSPAR